MGFSEGTGPAMAHNVKAKNIKKAFSVLCSQIVVRNFKTKAALVSNR